MPEDAEPIPERKPSSGENKRRPLTVPAGNNNNNNNNNNNQPGKITRTVCARIRPACTHAHASCQCQCRSGHMVRKKSALSSVPITHIRR
jgi:hypothetical protein